MNRAKLGSALFIAGVLFALTSPRNAVESEPTAALALTNANANASTNGNGNSDDAEPAALANAGLKAIAAPEIGTSGACGEGMLEVEGDYCAEVEQKCTRYIDPEGVFPRRCAEFAPTSKCQGKTTKKHFCIDKYEWPNKAGVDPVVMKTWYEARDACAGAGKRLCGDSEWTLACEGQERLPYPYGYDRNSEACNIDKPHPDVNEKALGSSDPKVREAEAKRLWQGEASGSRPSCVSPYGVMDMTGNVDEWVVNESGVPYKSGLKGGYWGPVRDRCRPETTIHSEGFSFYQIGFRCCSDVPNAAPSADAKPTGGTSAPSTKTPAPASSVGS
ncbi:MAG: SUMF1/EgtB/PvdO family nonheme iron enzyme [Labilithrix sp.]|nr:SUMF1/EgtB/PvdO family nonheme iron enzyme [Labilithrix sp.]MCW5816524.1 SUMF1/EgtB/PvdO family nonheme iron enzyme [Labilithrix sp.]